MKTKIMTLISVVLLLSCSQLKKSSEKNAAEEKRKNIAEWVKQEFEMMKDPATGKVDREGLWKILEQKVTAEKNESFNFTESGIAGFSWKSVGPTDYGGRSRAMLISAADPTHNTAFIGSVSGGIWKTTNLKAVNPSWVQVNDYYGNLNIGSFAQDPNNPNRIYAGTGEAFYNADGLAGRGIMLSTDAGNTFSFLPATQINDFSYVPSVKVLSNGHILAATHNGLQRSTDNGVTWARIFGGSNTRFGDLELASNGTLFLSTNGSIVDGINGEGCFRSTDNGATWTKLNTVGSGMESADGNIDYIELAVAPSNSNVVYATITKGAGFINVYKSTNAGTNWTVITRPILTSGNYVNQGSFAVSMGVDPNNENVVQTGGLDLFGTKDGGATWTKLSTWSSHPVSLHADHHIVYYEPGSSNTIYYLTDGGIQRTNNGTSAGISFDEIGNNFVTMQFYAAAMTPTAGKYFFLAGSQDNGTWKAFPSGPVQDLGAEVNGGDGGFTHIDQNQPNYKFCSYVYSNLYRSVSSDEDHTSFFNIAHAHEGKGFFINPSDYDNANNNMYLSSDAGKYLRWNDAANTSLFDLVTVPAFGTAKVSSVHVSEIESNTVYFGLNDGKVIKTTNAETGTTNNTSTMIGAAAPRTNAFLNCVYQYPADANRIIISYSSSGGSGRVFLTTNAGNGATATWTNVTGNLPNIPVWSVLLNPDNPDEAIAGTEFGTYSTTSLSAIPVVWTATANGMPNVRVTQLHTRTSDKLVVASTYGRGLFVSDVFMSPAANFASSDSISYTGKILNFNDISVKATSWDWDFNNDGVYEISTQNPSYSFSTPGNHTITLRINGNNSLKKTATVKILQNRIIPYTIAGGGGFEINAGDFHPVSSTASSFTRGNSSIAGKNGTMSSSANAWVLDIGNTTYTDNARAYLYTPSYNLTVAGTYNFSFFSKFNYESEYDGLWVEYTTDKGNTWNVLGNSVQANWYNSTNSGPLPVSAFFSGTVNNYTKYDFNISSLAGNAAVGFRFVFASDASITEPGGAIDNFEITGPPSSTLPIESITLTGKYFNNEAHLQWAVLNASDVKAYHIEVSADGSRFSTAGIINNGVLNGNTVLSKSIPWSSTTNKLYYRITGETLDGKKHLSNTVLLTKKTEDAYLKVLQGDKNTITLHTNMDGARYIIYNAGGVKLMQGTIGADKTLRTGYLPSGIYILQAVDSNNKRIAVKFVM